MKAICRGHELDTTVALDCSGEEREVSEPDVDMLVHLYHMTVPMKEYIEFAASQY